MQEGLLWLTVFLDDSDPCWPPNIDKHRVSVTLSKTLLQLPQTTQYRTSPIFPLDQNFLLPKTNSFQLIFNCFEVGYKVLGRIQKAGSDKLKRCVYYSIGLASVILITDDPNLNNEFLEIIKERSYSPRDTEVWDIKDSRISEIHCNSIGEKEYDKNKFIINNYDVLPVALTAVIDEFVAAISLAIPKVAKHVPSEIETYLRTVEQINKLIEELVYLHKLDGPPPATLDEYNEELLKSDKAMREKIIHQNTDRIIQVNSALSYISTQALSGAVPILERRSIIRRHSLLGIGSAILALTRISHSVEIAFSKYPIEYIIDKKMSFAKPLSGLDKLPGYDSSSWEMENSVDIFKEEVLPRDWLPKLPYFSGRLGFRETEFTISAAQQAISAGVSLEWSLLTITHELLHGHVRNLINTIFKGDEKKLPEQKHIEYYERYLGVLKNQEIKNYCELDSIRAIILAYCSQTPFSGSLTHKKKILTKESDMDSLAMKFRTIDQNRIWQLFEVENRNIHEIFVHILDFHYFYGSCLSAYIPLIWRSWSAVPHVGADLRQYILRSLLTIATTLPQDAKQFSRFNLSVKRLDEILGKHIDGVLNYPIIHGVRNYLRDSQKMRELFFPFSASLILVDLVNNIFVSERILRELLADPLADWSNKDSGFEEDLKYFLPEHFSEETVLKPAPYLIYRILRQLGESSLNEDVEAETAKLLLACCSR